MINNRQNGRRRGRGGQQVRNGQPGVPDRGSRVDNRARGNAAQLLEKYKSLARDAQMQGDRVNTEYYLQFADHYFRVLSENRSRFEEQRPDQQRARHENYRDDSGQDDNRDDNGEDDAGDDRPRGYDNQGNGWDGDDGDNAAPEQARYEPRREESRRDEPRREEARREEVRREEPRRDEPRREEPRRERMARDPAPEAQRPVIQDEGERYQERRPRRARPARPTETNGNLALDGEPPVAERIEVDRLPQGFGTTPPPVEAAVEEVVERPRRRAPRRPRTDTPTVEA